MAGRATSARNHALNCTPGAFNMVGRRAEDNAVRMDLEEAAGMLAQGVKALTNTIRAVRPGGVLLVRAREGTGVFGLANRKFPVGRGVLRLLAPLLLPLVPRLKIAGMGEEDRFFLYFALQSMRHARVLLYAPTIPITEARRLFPARADVRVFPSGGITYPEIGAAT